VQIIAKRKGGIAVEGFNIDQLVSFKWEAGKPHVTESKRIVTERVKKADSEEFEMSDREVVDKKTTYTGQKLTLTFSGNVVLELTDNAAQSLYDTLGKNQLHFASFEENETPSTKKV
jgi:hypothetical protein